MYTFLVTCAGLVAILLTLRRMQKTLRSIMTDQEKLDADVQTLGTAAAGIADEITSLKAQAAAAQPAVPLDFSKLDAAVAGFQALVLPVAPAPTPAP